MTLVYPKIKAGDPPEPVLPPTPVTHAFVLGCGRFPHLSSTKGMDRGATVAGARQMLEFLTAFGPSFIAPLATIECLISDPAVDLGDDSVDIVQEVPVAGAAPAAPVNVQVGAVLEDTVRAAGKDWVKRCRPGDHMFFYMSSHGIATEDAALGLLEDVLSEDWRKWSQSLNVTTLSQGLLTRGADRVWAFLDACQEVILDVLAMPSGPTGINLVEYTVGDLIRLKRKPVALAGSRFGGKAWAPTDGRPPYFTQALLEGLKNACVEPLPGLGWVVTGQQIMFGLESVANAALDWTGLQTEPLHKFNESGLGLLSIPAPKVPIKISTSTEAHFARVVNGSAVSDDNGAPAVAWAANPDGELAWRFTVDANRRRQFTATLAFKDGQPQYQPQAFDAMPPAQVVVLKT